MTLQFFSTIYLFTLSVMVYRYYNTAQFYSHSGNTVLLFTKMYDACNVYLDSDLYILILRKIFSLHCSKKF